MNGNVSRGASIGVAGLDHSGMKAMGRIGPQAAIPVFENSANIGDQVAGSVWGSALWFADFTYAVKQSSNGLTWRNGREAQFSPKSRLVPIEPRRGYSPLQRGRGIGAILAGN